MIQTRKSIFETNSSSTHTVCIHKNSKPENFETYYYIDGFGSFEFGRCESYLVESFNAKLAYAYLVVKDLSNWDKNKTGKGVEDFKKIVFDVAKEFYAVPRTEYERHAYLYKETLEHFFNDVDKMYEEFDAYVDHTEDFIDNGFFEMLVTDADFVKRFLFDEESYITIGGDEYRGYSIKKIGFEYDYDDKSYNSDYKYQEDENGLPIYVDPRYKYAGEFWDKVKKVSKEFDIYFKGN